MTIGQPERATQNRVVALFRDELGYRTLGNWTDRPNNSNVEVALLTAYLSKRGYSAAQLASPVYMDDAELAQIAAHRGIKEALEAREVILNRRTDHVQL